MVFGSLGRQESGVEVKLADSLDRKSEKKLLEKREEKLELKQG